MPEIAVLASCYLTMHTFGCLIAIPIQTIRTIVRSTTGLATILTASNALISYVISGISIEVVTNPTHTAELGVVLANNAILTAAGVATCVVIGELMEVGS